MVQELAGESAEPAVSVPVVPTGAAPGAKQHGAANGASHAAKSPHANGNPKAGSTTCAGAMQQLQHAVITNVAPGSDSDAGPSSHSHDTADSKPGQDQRDQGDHAAARPAAGGQPAAPSKEAAEHSGGDGDVDSRFQPGRLAGPQPVDEMPGCYRCRFSTAGCDGCRAKPFLTRPYVRWQPKEARLQEGVPSAPTFYPTEEQFKDPIAYINSIRAEGEKFGVCRIVPPASWDPPFALTPEEKGGGTFRFQTRKQFTSHLSMRAPSGMPVQQDCADGNRMGRMCAGNMQRFAGAANAEAAPVQQQQHAGSALPEVKQEPAVAPVAAPGPSPALQPAAAGTSALAWAAPPAAAAAGRKAAAATQAFASKGVAVVAPSNEQRCLQPAAAQAGEADFYLPSVAAHPLLEDQLPACSKDKGDAQSDADSDKPGSRVLRRRRVPAISKAALAAAMLEEQAQLSSKRAAAAAVQQQQQQQGGGGRMGSAKGGGRMSAASQPADDGEEEEEDDGGGGDFGFLSSEKLHTLKSFQAYCKWAKCLHYNMPLVTRGGKAADEPALGVQAGRIEKGSSTLPRRQTRSSNVHEPTVDELEAEFWRIVERPTPGHVVETLYGSDLDSGRYGSGFPLPPWRAQPTERPDMPRGTDKKSRQYAVHPWNINNLPRNVGSVLRYIETDELITGVMVPWLYVGSCMSAFCWHVEDHALYSINYMHMGAHKVWYGVPATASAKFEAAMKDALPHLFRDDPLLLHRLVTMLSPKELRARGVPVYRLVHEARSFVITFPNAYHAGFNCGFNCAEAVNFAPADWLPYGTDVIEKYRSQGKRITVSHDQLIVRLISAAPMVKKAQEQPAAAAAAAAAEEEAAASRRSKGDNDPLRHSWQAGTSLSEVPPHSIGYAAGELALRLDEERRRRAVAKAFGITKEKTMSGLVTSKDNRGVHTNTHDVDCAACKCDLHMCAVVSSDRPGAAVCPEHAAQLGPAAPKCTMLVRQSLEQLQDMLDTALRLFPEAQAYVDAARRRVATPPCTDVKPLGPICKFGFLPLPSMDEGSSDEEAGMATKSRMASRSKNKAGAAASAKAKGSDAAADTPAAAAAAPAKQAHGQACGSRGGKANGAAVPGQGGRRPPGRERSPSAVAASDDDDDAFSGDPDDHESDEENAYMRRLTRINSGRGASGSRPKRERRLPKYLLEEDMAAPPGEKRARSANKAVATPPAPLQGAAVPPAAAAAAAQDARRGVRQVPAVPVVVQAAAPAGSAQGVSVTMLRKETTNGPSFGPRAAVPVAQQGPSQPPVAAVHAAMQQLAAQLLLSRVGQAAAAGLSAQPPIGGGTGGTQPVGGEPGSARKRKPSDDVDPAAAAVVQRRRPEDAGAAGGGPPAVLELVPLVPANGYQHQHHHHHHQDVPPAEAGTSSGIPSARGTPLRTDGSELMHAGLDGAGFGAEPEGLGPADLAAPDLRLTPPPAYEDARNHGGLTIAPLVCLVPVPPQPASASQPALVAAVAAGGARQELVLDLSGCGAPSGISQPAVVHGLRLTPLAPPALQQTIIVPAVAAASEAASAQHSAGHAPEWEGLDDLVAL